MKAIAVFQQVSRGAWGIVALAVGLSLGASWTIGSGMAGAQGASEQAQLAREVSGVPVSLAQGLAASRSEGTPISAKFELEDGKLQLSVYTKKGGGFSEVIVDHKSGRISKTEAITGGDDSDD